MKVGIIGYAGCGKTTFFNALAAIAPEASSAKINLREVKVPDERIDRLSALYQPQKTIYATISLVDLPGHSPGSGGGFEAQSLAKMREMDLLTIVVRAFPSHLHATQPNPKGEANAMLAELLLADQVMVERKLERMNKEKNKGPEKELMEKLHAALEQEIWLKDLDLTPNEIETLTGYRFLTLKPALVVLNTPEEMADDDSAAPLLDNLSALPCPVFPISAKVESEIALLDTPDQLSFLADLGIQGTAKNRFIRKVYHMLDYISFFTVGEDEVRAWTITKGQNAQQAAGKIHTDLAKHFIRAERMRSEDLLNMGSEAKVKEAGKFELKGKTYLPEDGDILHIRANA